jgi:hypothetical protein
MSNLATLRKASETLEGLFEGDNKIALQQAASMVQHLGNDLYQNGTSIAQINKASKIKFEEFGGAAILLV